METKLCPHCYLEKGVSEFYLDSRTTDGLYWCCKQCHREDNVANAKIHRQKRNAYHRKWYEENKEHQRRVAREYRQRVKGEVLTHYGGEKLACVMCGEGRLACLSIDHINEDGADHRRALGLGKSVHFCEWLKSQNYPEGYQTLCMNCQWIKRDNWRKDED